MSTGVASWSQTAASNSNSDSNINWAEGQAPSSVNDSARALMASVAKWRDDLAGTLTTGGSSTAYTLTTNQVFGSLTALNGMCLRVKFHTTCGATPTLAVDGLAAKNIVTVTGTNVTTGCLIANYVYDLVYSNSSTEFIVVNSTPVASFPAGTVMVFAQTSAPTGWVKGATHDNKALRLVTGAAGTGGSTAFTSIFAARTIAQANLPNVNLSVGNITLAVDGSTAGGGKANTTLNVSAGASGAVSCYVSSPTISVGGNVPLGGSGTALDFDVQYVDVILATKA